MKNDVSINSQHAFSKTYYRISTADDADVEGLGPTVVLGITTGNCNVQDYFNPSDARKLAQALWTAAVKAEGPLALSYFPPNTGEG
jgi:hypothetical protein